MKHLVPTLSALALVSITAGTLSAASISPKEENLSIAIKGQLQTRLTLGAQGTFNDVDAGGYPYSYAGGNPVYYGAYNASVSSNATPPVTTFGVPGSALPWISNASSASGNYTGTPQSMAAARYMKDGESYDPINGTAGEAQKARFDMRRVRLAVEAKYKDGWKGNITLAADKTDGNGYAVARNPTLYYANVGKGFKTGELEHEIGVGLDKPYTNESSISSSAGLLPTNRPAGDFVDSVRGVGAQYKILNKAFLASVNFFNNTTATGAQGGSSNGLLDERVNGYFASLRVEGGMMPKKKQESYLGAEGTEFLVGYEVQSEWDKQVAYQWASPFPYVGAFTNLGAFNPTVASVTSWSEQSFLLHGPDVLVHAGALTAIAEYKMRKTSWESRSDGQTSVVNPEAVNSTVWNVQAGFAIPLADGQVIEPAARFAVMDFDTKRDEYSNYGRGVDYSGTAGNISAAPNASNTRHNATLSGNQIELGVNWYLTGNTNKLQFSYLNWQAEAGEGDAQMFIVQHQLTF